MKRRDFLSTGLVAGGTILLGKQLFGLKYFPNPAKEKWAVIFGSRYGSTRDAAIWISEGMGGIADVFDARENPDVKPFDHLILGSGIYGGKVTSDLEAFITANQAAIKGKVRGYFVVCGQGERGQAAYIPVLEKLAGVQVQAVKSFPGRMTKGLLTEEDYKGLEGYYKKNNRPYEDYDTLSRKDCLAYGDLTLKSTKK